MLFLTYWQVVFKEILMSKQSKFAFVVLAVVMIVLSLSSLACSNGGDILTDMAKNDAKTACEKNGDCWQCSSVTINGNTTDICTCVKSK